MENVGHFDEDSFQADNSDRQVDQRVVQAEGQMFEKQEMDHELDFEMEVHQSLRQVAAVAVELVAYHFLVVQLVVKSLALCRREDKDGCVHTFAVP